MLDKLFITITIFLIVYAWINFYVRSLWTTFVLSLVLTFAIVYVLYFIINKKANKKEASFKETTKINKNFLYFRLTPKTERLKLLKQILEKNYKTELKNNMLTYLKDEKLHLVILATQFEILTQNDLLNLVDEFVNINVDVIDIFCAGHQNITTNIFKNKAINLIDKQALYEMCKVAEIFPNEENINTSITKFRFIDLIKGMFARNKSRSYFICGLILIFSSIILPYHIYYIIFGSALLLFSIICKVLPYFCK